MTPEIGGVVRTILAFIAGFVASKGWIDQTLALELAGALGVLIIGGLSWWQKRVQKKEVAVAILTKPDAASTEEAKDRLTPQEITRAMSQNLPPAEVSGTGKVT